MIITISNLTDSVSFAADSIRCYLDTENMDTNTIAIDSFSGIDEQIINNLDYLQFTDCRVNFADTPEAESALYLDCAEFNVYNNGCKIVITGEDLRWA